MVKSHKSERSMKSSKSLKSLISVRPGNVESEVEDRNKTEQIPISQVFVTVVNKFECPINVAVYNDYIEDPLQQIQGDAKVKKRKDVTPMISFAGSASDDYKAPVEQQDIDESTLVLNASYDQNDHLVKVSMNKYRRNRIPRVIMQVLGIILPSYNKLSKFTLSDCAIDKYTIFELSKIVTSTKITDISLDSTFLPEGNYDLLLQKPTSLRNLSLRRCKINDEVCIRLVSYLHFSEATENMLVSLNLSSNRITDEGAKAIGMALKYNRRLRYLNLADNHITDEGASYIFDALREFPLTHEEVLDRRWQYIRYLRNKHEVYLKCLTQLDSTRAASETLTKRSKVKRRLSVSNLKNKSSAKVERESNVEDCMYLKAELMAADLVGPFEHPFSHNQVSVRDGFTYCKGNMILCYLNLAYNSLMFPSVIRLLDVLECQRLNRHQHFCGLMKLILEGNNLPSHCSELDCISDILVGQIIHFSSGKRGNDKVLSKRHKISIQGAPPK